jgi:hypothetical protein
MNQPKALFLWVACVSKLVMPFGAAAENATGVVFLDLDGNRKQGPSERGLPGVGVSNGRQVVKTDAEGRYSIEVDEDDILFVIKPRNYISPLDDLNISRFYYVHKPAGSPKLQYPGVSPTGPLPESVDFPLVSHREPDRFQIIALGDPQPRNIDEINYFAHDIAESLIGTDAAFGISLGDIVFDDLNLYEPYNEVIKSIGIAWHNIHGNHDMNYDVTRDELADETWERVYGPSTYSFNWGPVHFIALDGVHYDGHIKRGHYHSEVGRHLEFIENDLKHVPHDQLIVLMMHIPLVETLDRERLFDLLRDRPYTFSISAHWHIQMHFFMGAESGWHGERPHHHLVHATACGSWWHGAPDEFGIPHGMMRCGAPNGHSVITFTGHEYSIRFIPARRPASCQMSVFAPDSISPGQAGSTEVVANVYAGSERSRIRMRVGHRPWEEMTPASMFDPYFLAIKVKEQSETPPDGRKLPGPLANRRPHIWTKTLPADLQAGAHVIEVHSIDMFGQEDFARRIIRVVDQAATPAAGE